MKPRKVPMRMCVVTRESLEKKELFRIVRGPDGKVVYDSKGKLNGKGAYLKKDKDVIKKAQKMKILDKVLDVDVPDDIYEELLENIKEKE